MAQALCFMQYQLRADKDDANEVQAKTKYKNLQRYSAEPIGWCVYMELGLLENGQ